MFLVLLVLFSSIVFFLYKLKQRRTHNDEVERIPGPPLRPIIGNALEFGTNTVDILKNLKRLAKQYGPVVRLRIGSSVHILLSEPKYIGQILSDERAYKSDLYDFLKVIGGSGLVTSSGELWSKHRRIISPTFGYKHLEKFMTVFNRNANKLVQDFKDLVDLESVDVTEKINNCALNVVCNATMQVDLARNKDFHKAIANIGELIIKKFFSPIKRFNFLYSFTSDYQVEQRYLRTIRDLTDGVIAKRKAEMAAAKGESVKSLLDQLLKSSGEDVLTDKEMRDEVQTFIIAGSETVASTLNFALFELAKNPGVQEKILEETNQILGTDKNVDLSFNDARNLPYTDCVIKETLRTYSFVPFLTRKLPQKVYFGKAGRVGAPSGYLANFTDDLPVPAGVNIIIFISGTHLSEKIFPEPEKFDPTRFLQENFENLHPYAYIPFGKGPRACIGQKFAMLEAKVMLAKLVRNYKISAVQPEHKVMLSMAGTIKSVNGLPIRLRLR